jgi:hypothetical protein
LFLPISSYTVPSDLAIPLGRCPAAEIALGRNGAIGPLIVKATIVGPNLIAAAFVPSKHESGRGNV